jgi:hypothetical protein
MQTIAQQTENIVSKQIWLDYNPSYIIDHKISVYSDFGARTIIPNDWYRYYFRVGINYKPFILTDKHFFLKNLQFHGGFGDFYTLSVYGKNLNEIRLYQGVRGYWPNRKRVRISHYIRIEERFEDTFNSETSSFNARLRYQLGAKFRFKKEAIRNLYLPLSVEFFMSLDDGLYFNDVMRFTPGVGYDFSDTFRTEFHLSYHNSRNSPTESFENNDLVFRFRVFQIF